MSEPVSDALVLPSRLAAIDDGRRWLSRHAEAAGFGEEELWALELVLTEALSNVIRHSYGCDPDQEIGLALAIDDASLCLSIEDYGRGFDPEQYSPPDLGEPQTRGYGVYLMRQLMDEVVVDQSPEGVVLRLVKYRARRRDD